MKERYADLLVDKDVAILSVLKKMDRVRCKLLIVMDQDRFKSVVSIGDIQRAIIKGISLDTAVGQILRQEVCYALNTDDLDVVRERMKARRNEMMPVVTDDGHLQQVIFWEDLVGEKAPAKVMAELNLPVIIMAGGQGTRLKPLTNVLPKPLMPINEKTIIEDIMDRFVDCGCQEFFISVNYKADFIRYYLNSLQDSRYRLNYFQEERPLGTAGSLHLLKDNIASTFFVSNCDILIEQDYGEILEYHRDNKNEITVVAALKQLTMPYGTLTTGNDGILTHIEEKPEIAYKVNTGFYILEPHLLNEIPVDTFYHITTLIEALLQQKRRVGVFPVSEKSWTDIGNWEEYYTHIRSNHG
ncbi:nucleotidyltransferase family protein [Trichlorobacter lovleyi]|uniref:nucleotidyltransferase family protein n=1 Tax=Trichlorobacter lovleyi TaxID=313985 RepID=UPI003D0B4991